MKKYCSLNVFVSLFLTILGAAWLALCYKMRGAGIGDSSTWGTGATIPKFILYVFIALNIWDFISEILAAGKRQAAETQDAKANRGALVVVLEIVALLVYSFVMEYIGFIIGTIALMVVTMLLLGEKNKLLLVAVPVGFTAFLYVVFQYALKITIPTLFI